MKKAIEISDRAITVLTWVLISGVIVVAAIAYYFIHQPPVFTGYVPTVKLNGSSIEKTELRYMDVDNFAKTGIAYVQMYKSGATLDETDLLRNHITGESWVTCAERQKRHTGSDAFECKESQIKNGGKYSVSVTRRSGKVIDIWVEAEIGETNLWVRIPEKQWEEYARYDGWQQYFDSMKPKSLLFTPYEYRPSPLRAG